MFEIALDTPHLVEIFASENLRHDTSTLAHLNLWCEESTRRPWTSDIEFNTVVWRFHDKRDAIRFRLFWG